MEKTRISLVAVCGCLFMLTNAALAVPYIGMIDHFDNSPAYPAWTAHDLLNAPVVLPAEAGQVIITALPGDPPSTVIAWTPNGSPWAGSYNLGDITYVRFVLTTPDSSVAPQSLNLYFRAASGNEWAYTLFTPGFGPFTATIGSYSVGWVAQNFDPLGNDQSLFETDILSIANIGVYVSGTGAGGTYYLDDFEIGVPEPETVWMILAVLLSLGVTFRSQLAGMAGQVKARVFGA
jgi:hypothetical protein